MPEKLPIVPVSSGSKWSTCFNWVAYILNSSTVGYPMFEDSGPKYNFEYSFQDQRPQRSGTWTLGDPVFQGTGVTGPCSGVCLGSQAK